MILSALTGQVMLDPYCSAVQRVSLPDGAQVDFFVCVHNLAQILDNALRLKVS